MFSADNPINNDFALLTEDVLLKVCKSRARQLNQLAAARGQSKRTSASELMDMYYQQAGRCDDIGVILEYHSSKHTPFSMEIDHIKEINRHKSLKQANEQFAQESGECADIENLRWVCRFANQFKEACRSAGINRNEIVKKMAEIITSGISLRATCKHLGAKGRKQFRGEFIKQCVAQNTGISAAEVCRRLQGTIGEACENVVRCHMKELGFLQHSSSKTWPELRRQVLLKLHSECGLCFDSVESFLEIANQRLQHWKGYTVHVWRNDAKLIGLRISFKGAAEGYRTRARSTVCNGDMCVCLHILKRVGDCGIEQDALLRQCRERGIPDHLAEDTLNQVLESFAAYEHQGLIFAALTRAEAAKRIGVSRNRLKKWGRSDWHDQFAGPGFCKTSKKGLTYYRRHDVDEFISNRGTHHLDLSSCGQRPGCVTGGAIGGQRAAIGHSLRRAGSLVVGSASGGE